MAEGRPRNPQHTREAILNAAREVLAQDGKEGLSVARVAQRARVNRGTAYQHFQTREQLVEATAVWVSDKLFRAVFGDLAAASQSTHIKSTSNIKAVNQRLAEFAMENPELGRVWLFEVLSSRRPSNDLFWRQYASKFERFTKTEFAQPGMDVEVLAVLFLAGSFIWPVWARAHTRTASERKRMSARFSRELLRLCLHGTLRPEKYAELDVRSTKRPRAAAGLPASLRTTRRARASS